ncbi:PHD finger protein 20-like isoform X8 [Plodia interpunctella]|uniref:PHD finger protein 20-like isoform X8 n=1 Tax=Plodia interpunctella TaxID=58824 RepID=UPI0023684ABE|nr:PHD finger protein 20-like isoform X6 [Plodia interpunctella]
MVLRKCSILHCISCSTRKEDIGVTYHKYPKDVSLRAVWAEVSKIKIRDIQLTTYVCSRHFRKSDFQMYKDSKYVLKSDSIPSIFPWTTMDTDTDSSKADDTNTESVASKTVTDNVIMETDDETKEIKALNSSKESDGENLDAIRKYIEEQEKEIQELTAQSSEKKNEETKKVAEVKEIKSSTEETMDVASSMMDMILSESEARIAKKDGGDQIKGLSTPEKGSSSVALSVGSQVEAKDFAEFWHPAEIMEVDYDEMEVLVRYDNPAKSRHDEWISVSSPRLRPRGTSEALPGETPQIDTAPEGTPQDMTAAATIPDPQAVTEELKVEDKVKLTFVVGERCLARWRDNRRFMATITKDLGEGKYEIAFDDGFQWKCAVSRLCKYKENLSVDTGSLTPSASVPSPIQHGVGPSGAPLLPAYHTHLFDPNRDYLGSKSERREMKRKLNVKELFNIGQKKRKKIPEEKPQKVMTPKKQKVVKKKITPSKPDSKKKVSRNDIPEAVASIIGTVNEELEQKDKLDSTAAESVVTEAKDDIKDNMDVENEIVETSSEITISETEGKAQELDVVTHSQIDTTVANNVLSTSVNDNSICENAADMLTIENEALVIGNNESSPEKDSPCAVASETIKTEDLVDKTETVGETHKTIPEEELKLEIFEKQDEVKHEEVIDKIKEVITKIEGDLNHVQVESPKAEIKIEGIKEEAREKSKKLSKIKKGKKLRLLQEKKVKKQVEKVKNELEEMKRQVEEMRKQMLMKTGGVEGEGPMQMPESFLLPGEWCCKWVNGQPVGKVCELESDPREEAKGGLPRRSVQVEDKRLPEGWTKHMVRRSLGHSAGKWDVVLVSPDNRRFHTKTDMRNYLENNPDEELKQYEHALMDFGVHLKLSRRMGWFTTTPGGTDDIPVMTLPAGTLNTTSPLVKRRKLSLKNRPRQIKIKMKEKKRKPARKGYEIPSAEHLGAAGSADGEYMVVDTSAPLPPSDPPLEDGYDGERIKIVHMKREEIINCHCGFREEDGLMVQCELCLCWQHALCHNIQKESEVPEKYTCSICLNPWRGRRSKRFVHDQDRLYEGALPGGGGGGGAGAGGGGTNARLRRAHELGGNLLRLQDALHALQVKYHVAVKKDHPKLYLWAKDWENGDINMTQERLNSEYSDLNIMLNSIGKENMRIKVDDLNNIDMDHDRVSQRDGLNPVVLSGLVSSPGALELPLSGSELERLAGDAQDEQELPRGPQPEAAIENGPCRERLLRHIQRCQAIIDARLDSIEAQVAELESQDPSFEDDETADYFPRTKQTIQMLMRDLDTMEELGAS